MAQDNSTNDSNNAKRSSFNDSFPTATDSEVNNDPRMPLLPQNRSTTYQNYGGTSTVVADVKAEKSSTENPSGEPPSSADVIAQVDEKKLQIRDIEARKGAYEGYAKVNIAILENARDMVANILKQAQETKDAEKAQECTDYLTNLNGFLAVEYKNLYLYLLPRGTAKEYYEKAIAITPNLSLIPDVSDFQIYRFKHGITETQAKIAQQIAELWQLKPQPTINC